MLLRLTAKRGRSPARWIVRWALAIAICLTLTGEAAAPPAHPSDDRASVVNGHGSR
jgi:hypothetical protein